jgi:hypothetical protein
MLVTIKEAQFFTNMNERMMTQLLYLMQMSTNQRVLQLDA